MRKKLNKRKKMDLSIIIPVYNAKKTIRDCLLSILDSDFDKNFEIIVVNDGSTDKSIEGIKDLNVRIVYQNNKGAGAARNNGAKHARSNLIIFIDSDIIIFKDTLRKVYKHLKKKDVHYVSGRYSKRPLNNKWIHKYKALADYSYYYDLIFTKEQKKKPIRQVAISGAVEGYKKKIFEKLGGFDERVKGAGVEEETLRAKLAQNYNMIADPNIRFRHHFPDFNKLVKDYFYRTFDSMSLMCKYDYQPYLKKNGFRVALGTLTVLSLFFSLVSYLVSNNIFPFVIVLILFLTYLWMHLSMFILAFKEKGPLFVLYTIVINLFFCCVISLAGFLGMIRYYLK